MTEANEKCITAEEFLTADDLQPERVALPAAYGKDRYVLIRSMDGRERSDFEKEWVDRKGKEDFGAFRADVLQRTLMNDQGQPLFTKEQRPTLLTKNSGTLEILFERACRLNGLTESDVKDLEKNSETGQ